MTSDLQSVFLICLNSGINRGLRSLEELLHSYGSIIRQAQISEHQLSLKHHKKEYSFKKCKQNKFPLNLFDQMGFVALEIRDWCSVLPLGCCCLFLPPSIIHSKTAMAQKRTDMEQEKKGGGRKKNKNKVGCSQYFNGCSQAVLHLRG